MLTILDFMYFWWIIGILVSLILYSLFSYDFKLKWYQGLAIGLINLVILAIGAKLLYIAEQLEKVINNGLSFNGFSLYGAIFIMPLAFYVNSKIFKLKSNNIALLSIIPLIVMLAFYRLDCYKNGCCGGILINGFRVPTQMIEAVSCLLLATIYYYFIYYKKNLNPNVYYSFYLAYGSLRFIIEFFRERENLFWLISISHIWSLLSIILGLILIIKSNQHKKEESL